MAGQVGYGTKLEYKVGAGSYTELADLQTLEPPELEVVVAEFHSLRTTRSTQRLPGSYNATMMKFSMLYVEATHTTLVGLRGDTTLTWKITQSDATAIRTFSGLIAKVGPKVVRDEFDVMDIEVAVNGDTTQA